MSRSFLHFSKETLKRNNVDINAVRKKGVVFRGLQYICSGEKDGVLSFETHPHDEYDRNPGAWKIPVKGPDFATREEVSWWYGCTWMSPSCRYKGTPIMLTQSRYYNWDWDDDNALMTDLVVGSVSFHESYGDIDIPKALLAAEVWDEDPKKLLKNLGVNAHERASNKRLFRVACEVIKGGVSELYNALTKKEHYINPEGEEVICDAFVETRAPSNGYSQGGYGKRKFTPAWLGKGYLNY